MRWAIALVTAGTVAACLAHDPDVVNRHPIRLRRPVNAELSAVARLGQQLFGDSSLSARGDLACASCHRPDHFHAAANATPGRLAGTVPTGVMLRAIPSLRYAYRAPDFSIGPEAADADSAPDLTALARSGSGDPHLAKVATATAAPAMVPVGGQFWDGRANTLQDQAMGPLFNPAEMANRSVPLLAARLRRSHYAAQFAQLFGSAVLTDAPRLVDEASFAIARYQIEDSIFHSYTSKYDYYLEGRAALTAAEARGLAAFEDKSRGNCAACHLDRPLADGTPPAFTDYEYEALGVPRNDSIVANHDPRFFDLGLCGPLRGDLAGQPQFCGMFRTPSLRNVATRAVFFHNGRYTSLDSVLAFYNFRAVAPTRVSGAGSGAGMYRYNDLPLPYFGNVDTSDAPFDRANGHAPPLTDRETQDIVAFLGTLTDGYRPPPERPDQKPR